MSYTTTVTSKGQITLPKAVRDKLGLKKGTKIDIFPTLDGEFTGKPKRLSNIMKFAGDLADLDDGRPWGEVRDEAQTKMAEEIVKTYQASKGKVYTIKIKKKNR